MMNELTLRDFSAHILTIFFTIELVHPYHLDESISSFRGSGGCFHSL